MNNEPKFQGVLGHKTPRLPHPTPQAAYDAQVREIDSARPKTERSHRRKPNHDELVDNVRASMRSRRSTVVRSVEVAVAMWEAVRIHGEASACDPRPRGDERTPPLEGHPVEVQVAAMVEETPGFAERQAGAVGAESWFMAELNAQLPQEFMHPWSGLCGAERDALTGESKARLAGGTGLETSEAGRNEVDGRLLPGMSRVEEAN